MVDVPTDPMGTVEVQEKSVISVPAQVRPLIQIGPVPSPKVAEVKDVVTVRIKKIRINNNFFPDCTHEKLEIDKEIRLLKINN